MIGPRRPECGSRGFFGSTTKMGPAHGQASGEWKSLHLHDHKLDDECR